MIPTAFEPRTDPTGEHFTIRQRRSWAPWTLAGLSAGAALFGVALLTDIPAGSLLFFPLSVALGYAAFRFYQGEITEIVVSKVDGQLKWLDVAVPLDELEKVEVLGDELPQLLVSYGGGRSTIIPAHPHSVEDAKGLAAALTP